MSNWTFLNAHRCTKPEKTVAPMYVSTPEFGFCGMFRFMLDGRAVRCVASDGGGWRHVSVSIEHDRRCPTWEMMCKVKDLFWDANDMVVQYHPVRSEYVNMVANCLHLWQPYQDGKPQPMPAPPSIMVGYK